MLQKMFTLFFLSNPETVQLGDAREAQNGVRTFNI